MDDTHTHVSRQSGQFLCDVCPRLIMAYWERLHRRSRCSLQPGLPSLFRALLRTESGLEPAGATFGFDDKRDSALYV
jgi:hypothetical protein